MRLSIGRDQLLKPLQQVAGVVEKKHTMPILANVLLRVQQDEISFTGTDLEVELVATQKLNPDQLAQAGEITIPCRKLLDICKSLPANANIELSMDEQKLLIKSGRSRFSLATLPAHDFPSLEEDAGAFSLNVSQRNLKRLIEKTAFAMAQQDVRYYLTGMLFEVSQNQLRTVTTDGHRLALFDAIAEAEPSEKIQVIVPRKGVQELQRLLADEDSALHLTFGNNHLQVTLPISTGKKKEEDANIEGFVSFTSKLIDGKFPDYQRVLPRGGDKIVLLSHEDFRQALQRASILTNEKYKGVRFLLQNNELCIQANNPEQEEAREELVVEYQGESLEIAFNVQYLLDVLNVLEGTNAKLVLSDANASILIQETDTQDALYVVMPMRL
ncbi:DNA polymerase III subunit beta [Agitococcus lubricus]|uniref:Beta sliding clamp n=1 Tax=Agitococcus lubricus TaxID=1077255 RepID=A0A2T5J3P6_9GAMM|nr:DNA polymerase III subunit beta [Agitococcus lubricus]PTQ91230.1 DNA polymerase III beta subunit [Agitococcus lubricus]